MATRKRTAMVAHEGQARKLEWHRIRGGLRAEGLRGLYVITARKGRTDRRSGLFPWVVTCNNVEIGSKDRIDEVKRVAQKHEQEANAVPSGSQPTSYRRRVFAVLSDMKSPDALGDVEAAGSYIDRMEAAGVDPATTASVVFATRHHGHFGGPKHTEFTAEESPTRSEWEIVVMGVPPNLKDAISAMAPSGASQIGSSLTLHGFYDDEKATAVARRITHQYGLLTTNGPKRWAVAAERPKTMEANDSAPGGCQPFTKLVRDPARFNACMAKSKQVGPMENSRGIYDVVVDDLSRQDQECFVVLCLDFRGAVRDYVEVARGQRHRVAVDPEDVLRPVLLSGCDGFAVIHNHPSGVAEPSDADGELTKRIRKAAEVACPTVKFVDHVVVGRGQWYSFTDRKLHKVK